MNSFGLNTFTKPISECEEVAEKNRKEHLEKQSHTFVHYGQVYDCQKKLFFALHICGFFDGLNTPFHGTFDVNSGTSAPWFDQPGGGTQYQLPMSIRELRRYGYIKIIKK